MRNPETAGQPAIVDRFVNELKPYARNARTHSKKQLKQIAASIERFGFTNPVLVSDDGEIIAGHGRVEAAKLLGLKTVPTIALSHLSATERRAYVLADNKLALNAGWDRDMLAIELQGLIDLEFDVELTGFGIAEIDFIIDDAKSADPDQPDQPEDDVLVVTGPAVSLGGPRHDEAPQIALHTLTARIMDLRSLTTTKLRAETAQFKAIFDHGIRHQKLALCGMAELCPSPAIGLKLRRGTASRGRKA